LAELITSLQNPKVKRLRSLRLRKYREQEDRFLVEGIRIVEEALAGAAPVETLVYAPDLLVSGRAQALVEQADPDRRLALSAEAFRSLSDRDDPQGIAAVVRIEDRPLSALPLSAEMLVVVAYQLSDPGNLGAIIRTADAAGATGVIVVTPSVDPYDPQAVRATMGSLFALPVIYPVQPVGLERWVEEVRAAGVRITAAHWPCWWATSAMVCRPISTTGPISSSACRCLGGPRHSTSRRRRRRWCMK
jgi:tRNA G18 (ribose-2'-O)-methylase SpoU